MNYDSDQLYEVLSTQCLLATDQVMLLLENQDPQLYDASFHVLSKHLKPLVMADHEVGLEARKNIISGMVQRTSLEGFSSDLNEHFIQFMDHNASEDLRNALTNAADGKSLWEHAHSFSGDQTYISPFCLYGNWMQSYPLFKSLEDVSRLDHEIIMYCIQNRKNVGQTFASGASIAQRRELLISRLDGMKLATPQIKQSITFLSSHEKFINISDHFFALDYEKYRTRSDIGEHRRLFDQNGVLSQTDLDRVEILGEELKNVWTKYQFSKKILQIEQWAQYVAQRSMGMLDNMKNASELHTIAVESNPVVVDFSKNIEKHRDITPRHNGKIYGSVSN